MARAAGCECHTKFSQIELPNMEVKVADWRGVGDGQYNGNEEE